jgi:ferredoxin
MSDVDERLAGGLTIRIDRLICVGFGDCIEACTDAFALDDEGIAVFKDTIDSVDRAELTASCESCPVDALTLLDSDGVQIVP